MGAIAAKKEKNVFFSTAIDEFLFAHSLNNESMIRLRGLGMSLKNALGFRKLITALKLNMLTK